MSVQSPSVIDYSRFPETDGVPMETEWHRDQMFLLVELGRSHHRDRDDVYVGGDLCMYYDPEDPRKMVGPDFFFVRGVSRTPRRLIWAAWVEGRLPDCIIELLSPTTKHKDRKTNKDIYEQIFRTAEYFLYDPKTERLDGWRLVEGRYEPIVPNENGRMWSEELGLWLGRWYGVAGGGPPEQWLRFYDEHGRLVPTFAESEQQQTERERRRAERQRRRAEREHERAEQERQRAEQERLVAEQERQRAAALEAELARLKALLDQQTPADETE